MSKKLPIFRPFYTFAKHMQEAQIMLERIVLHGEFSLFTVRGNFCYQIYQNQRQTRISPRLHHARSNFPTAYNVIVLFNCIP